MSGGRMIYVSEPPADHDCGVPFGELGHRRRAVWLCIQCGQHWVIAGAMARSTTRREARRQARKWRRQDAKPGAT